MSDTPSKIAELNDDFRTGIHCLTIQPRLIIHTLSKVPGALMLTCGISNLDPQTQFDIINKVNSFDDFSEDNDPYGEHDFGSFEHNAETIFWKIDYYDPTLTYGSEDPADISKTKRVLTILFACEY